MFRNLRKFIIQWALKDPEITQSLLESSTMYLSRRILQYHDASRNSLYESKSLVDSESVDGSDILSLYRLSDEVRLYDSILQLIGKVLLHPDDYVEWRI